MATPEHPGISSDHIKAVVDALDAECHELHRQYVSRRGRLLDICRESEDAPAATRRAAAIATITAGVVAASSAAYTLRHFARPRPLQADVAPRQLPAARSRRAAS